MKVQKEALCNTNCERSTQIGPLRRKRILYKIHRQWEIEKENYIDDSKAPVSGQVESESKKEDELFAEELIVKKATDQK